MNLVITGHAITITPALNEHIRQKVKRLVEHADHVVDVKVLLDVNKSSAKEDRQTAQCNIHVSGADFSAKSAHLDMYAAIDAVMDLMEEKLKRHKEKKRGRGTAKDFASDVQTGSAASAIF